MKQRVSDIAFEVVVPVCYSKKHSVDRNSLRQILVREHTAKAAQDSKGRISIRLENRKVVQVQSRRTGSDQNDRTLIVPTPQLKDLPKSRDLSDARWSGNLKASNPSDVRESFVDAFHYIEDNPGEGRLGLRSPQIGALHAVLGYWTTATPEPATVVMPTGTGKTETMLALLCSSQIEKLLVVVPSDTLRAQIAEKFESLGILQEFGVIHRRCLRPVVGRVAHAFRTTESARDFATRCNVIVTTPNALFATAPDARMELFSSCSHLFIDEAHHVAAETWRQVRDEFKAAHVVQFTATPFREDGRRLGGRLIYDFPLREAQRQGYFSRINYISVVDLSDQDRAIAQRAVEKLREDLAAGFDHIIMARVSRIGRADEVLSVYKEIADDLSPVILHSTRTAAERRAALEAVRNRMSRIIVCVNMLGEGFDLPSLKVAAIHDTHKSLAVTLQFIGRFARTTGSRLGEATVVVSRPDRSFDPQLRRLYAEDAEWNLIIRDLSELAVQVQQETSTFEAAFGSLPEEISMRNLLPKMSTVVYRTKSDDWNPQAAIELYGEDRLLTLPIAINLKDAVAWFVTQNRTPVVWGDVKAVEEVTYDLYVLYWDSVRQLLYINSSNNKSLHEDLAKAVCGEGAERIIGENVYRVMAQVSRLIPTNIGVLDIRNRSRRFSMHVGADVNEAFPTTEAQTKTKTNIFAYGYDEGSRISIGASLKGRIWSYRAAPTIRHWTHWCDDVGTKLIDEGISVDEVMRNFIRPKVLDKRPDLVPLGLEWPIEIFANISDELCIEYATSKWPVVDVDFELKTHERTGPIDFLIKSPDWAIEYRLEITNPSRFSALGDDGKLTSRFQSFSLEDYLNKHPLYVHFEQDTMVIPPGLLLRPDRKLPPYDPQNLVDLDWSGIKLNIESQGEERRKDSIQYRMIGHVMTLQDWDIVLDDDGSGEIADIVALKEDGQDLLVHLTHCKFVLGGKPRSQVEDLYQVCGQAQKSTHWRRNVPLFFEHLVRREKRRAVNGRTGFIKGDAAKLYSLLDRSPMLRPIYIIAIAQPGVTKKGVSSPQLELLASTETYVYETTHSKLEVYCSF